VPDRAVRDRALPARSDLGVAARLDVGRPIALAIDDDGRIRPG
jgi:hypothetical protein